MSGFLLPDLLEGEAHLFGIFRIARANAFLQVAFSRRKVLFISLR
jgi:hypothetical protein